MVSLGSQLEPWRFIQNQAKEAILTIGLNQATVGLTILHTSRQTLIFVQPKSITSGTPGGYSVESCGANTKTGISQSPIP
jgi:hypothetical protein